MPLWPISGYAHHAMALRKPRTLAHLEAGEYRQLAAFRHALRRFLRFSETATEK